MNKSWITKPQSSIAYQQGIKEFIDFAFKGAKENDVVICPCKRCGFRKSKSRSDMFDHLIWSPFCRDTPFGFIMESPLYYIVLSPIVLLQIWLRIISLSKILFKT